MYFYNIKTINIYTKKTSKININTPDFATHYYLAEQGPFKSLSELPLADEDPLFLELLTRYQSEPSYRRRYGRDYIQKRKVIEQRLRELFIARGGQPQVEHPSYLVLGASEWFKDLNAHHQSLTIKLAELNPLTTSITFPDSFIALSRADKPYFEKIYLLSELDELINTFGLPNNDHLVPYERYWEYDFELYIEIQIWEKLSATAVTSADSSSNLIDMNPSILNNKLANTTS
nr:hypothetical protein [uncultured Deefgea sp.]